MRSIPVDVCEKADCYELHASLPGVPKESVKVRGHPTQNPPVRVSRGVWRALTSSVSLSVSMWTCRALKKSTSVHALHSNLDLQGSSRALYVRR